MAVVWRALIRIPLRIGLRVAVIGDGTIAMLAAHLVRLFDPKSTIVFGRRQEQRALALRAGANDFRTTAPDTAFDLVIEASGSVDGVTAAIESCARGGMVILLGLPPHGARATFSLHDLVNNDVIIQASFAYTSAAFIDVVSRVNAHDLEPSFLITHRFELKDGLSAISTLRGGDSIEPRGKVVIALPELRR
jgi:threonine dehydrogenase-like Zn-dependent dehydrogenase